jgi:hypothetical protein
MIEQSGFDKMFESFRAKFPPVEALDQATLQLTTTEITEMIIDFFPDAEMPQQGITRFMISQGYRFEPIEVNERVRFFWLIGNG